MSEAVEAANVADGFSASHEIKAAERLTLAQACEFLGFDLSPEFVRDVLHIEDVGAAGYATLCLRLVEHINSTF